MKFSSGGDSEERTHLARPYRTQKLSSLATECSWVYALRRLERCRDFSRTLDLHHSAVAQLVVASDCEIVGYLWAFLLPWSSG